MKYADAYIAWSPGKGSGWWRTDTKNPGTVKVVYRPMQSGWDDGFLFTGGACYKVVQEAKGDDAVARLFIEWHHIVLRDRVDPEVAHQAFLAIDEYRDALAADIPGSTARGLM